MICRKARAGEAPRLWNLLRNWLHQAISYMDRGELTIRVLTEFVQIVLVTIILMYILSIRPYPAIATSFIMVHTWNWITNGLFWTVVIFAFPSLKNPGPDKTVDYLNQLRGRVAQKKCITGVALYGSISRGCWHERSDIDIRMLRRRGIRSLLCAALVTMNERFLAFWHRQPMDLYLADNVDFLLKLRADEVPVILLDSDKRLESLYQGKSAQAVNLSHLDVVKKNGKEDSPVK